MSSVLARGTPNASCFFSYTGDRSESSPETDDAATYSDEDFAMLRHIMCECGTSSRKFGAAFAGFWYFFKRTIPEAGDLFSRRTLKAKFMRMQHAEMMQL